LDSKSKEQQMYWATGVASIISNIVIPTVVYLSLGKSSKTPIEKYNLLLNEIGRQFISGSIGLLSFFGGGALVRAGINFYNKQKTSQKQMDEGDKHLYMLLGAIATKFISSALLKPLLSTQLILQFLEKEKTATSLSLTQVKKLLNDSATLTEATQKLSNLSEHLPKPEEVQGKYSRGLHVLMRKHFFDTNGQPKIGKFTAVTVVAKGTWLSLLALAIYGVTQLSQSKAPNSIRPQPKERQDRPSSLPIQRQISPISEEYPCAYKGIKVHFSWRVCWSLC